MSILPLFVLVGVAIVQRHGLSVWRAAVVLEMVPACAASDLADVPVMMVLVAGVVLTTLPLTWALRPALREIPAHA